MAAAAVGLKPPTSLEDNNNSISMLSKNQQMHQQHVLPPDTSN